MVSPRGTLSCSDLSNCVTIARLHTALCLSIATLLPKAKHSTWKTLAEEMISQGHDWQILWFGCSFFPFLLLLNLVHCSFYPPISFPAL